jgi:hypothetical protein
MQTTFYAPLYYVIIVFCVKKSLVLRNNIACLYCLAIQAWLCLIFQGTDAFKRNLL